MSISRFPQYCRIFVGCVLLCLTPGIVEAACIVSARTPKRPNLIPISPSGLLKSYPQGGAIMGSAVAQFAVDQPDQVGKLLVYSARATDRQLRAIAQGLRAVVESCRKEFPMAADDVSRVALRPGFSRFTAYYLEAGDSGGAPAPAAHAPARASGNQFSIPVPADTHPDLNQDLLADPFAPPR